MVAVPWSDPILLYSTEVVELNIFAKTKSSLSHGWHKSLASAHLPFMYHFLLGVSRHLVRIEQATNSILGIYGQS